MRHLTKSLVPASEHFLFQLFSIAFPSEKDLNHHSHCRIVFVLTGVHGCAWVNHCHFRVWSACKHPQMCKYLYVFNITSVSVPGSSEAVTDCVKFKEVTEHTSALLCCSLTCLTDIIFLFRRKLILEEY